MKPAAAAVQESAAPPVLLPYQRKWVSDTSVVKVWRKSRRIGASWCDASEKALFSAAESGQDSLYIGYSEDMTREYIEACAMWARAYSLAASEVNEFVFEENDEDGEKNSIKAFRIDFASGHKVLALSSRPRSIRGKQGKITIDEAAFHDDLPGLIKAAMAMLIWGGSVSIISSENGDDNPFRELVRDIQAGKLKYSLHETTFRDAVADGLYERVCLRLAKKWSRQAEQQWVQQIYADYGSDASEELDCIPRMGSGVYLPRVLVERCQDKSVPILRFSQKPEFVLNDQRLAITQRWIDDVLQPELDRLPGLRSVFGQDFGRSGDLSTMLPLQQHGPMNWKAPFGVELRRIPFDCQKLILFALIRGLPLFHHGKLDARGNGQSHAEAALQEFGGARIECVMATQQWYAENMPQYKAALEARTIVLPGGEDIIADHRRAVMVKGLPKIDDGHDKGSDGEQRHGDMLVAALMAEAATRQEAEPAAGVSIEPEFDVFAPDRRGRPRAGMGFGRKRA
jgi:phage FluMu gp28-like protein